MRGCRIFEVKSIRTSRVNDIYIYIYTIRLKHLKINSTFLAIIYEEREGEKVRENRTV